MRGGDAQGTNAVILGWDKPASDSSPFYEVTLKDSVLIQSDSEFIFSIGRNNDKTIELNGDEKIEVTIVLETNEGIINLNMNNYKELAPLLKVKYMKLPKMNDSFGSEWELNMETVALPLQLPTDKEVYLKKLQFSFDKSPKGMIALDNVGFRSAIHFSKK